MSDSTRRGGGRNNISCSFCGKSRDDVRNMLGGHKAYICDECVQTCEGILSNPEPREFDTIDSLPTPKQIKAQLDEYVIDQAITKKILSVSVYNHYKRLLHKDKQGSTELNKTNILMIGSTGCGKTLLAQTLARFLNVPFVIVDATALTEAGYVGEDVENIIQKLLQRADYSVEKAQKGIVYIDEIDKVARKSDNPSITRDVSGEGVQQALLKLIEGTTAAVPPQGGRKHPHQEYVNIDTKDILFICGGAFDGLEEIISRRRKRTGIGFASEVRGKKDSAENRFELLSDIQSKDLLRYGLIPEFVGRLPVIAPLHELDEKALARILTEPRNSLQQQYSKMLDLEGVNLKLTDEAIHAIANLAIKRGTGARGLRTILENVMLDAMYEIPSMNGVLELIVDKRVVTEGRMPILVKTSTSGRSQKRRLAAVG